MRSLKILIYDGTFIIYTGIWVGGGTDMDICLYNSCWSPTKRIRLMIIYVIILRSMPYTEMTSRDTCISKYTTKARHMRHPFSVVLPWSQSIKLQSVSVMVLSELPKTEIIPVNWQLKILWFWLFLFGNIVPYQEIEKSILVWINPSNFFLAWCSLTWQCLIRIAKLTFLLTFCE